MKLDPPARSASRRRFLRQAALAPLAFSAADGAMLFWLPPQKPARPDCGCQALPPLGGQVRYDAHCFSIAGRDRFIFSASMHYPRIPPELWRDRLLKLRSAGINCIETVVFWNYHELEPGRFDLSGFDAYCRLIGELGMMMIVRPGPYICAEWTTGGFPDWIVAERFPLRSPDPRSVATSAYWFNRILPVIRRHQSSRGGPIILMQIENEYDYWPLPDAEKLAYLSALAGMAWKSGIEVPLFTNWGKQVRERNNPVMARLFDTCDFYPRWNLGSVIPPLRRLRRQVPDAPLGVAELQGGWFAQVGGRLSIEQPGIGPEQLSSLTRLVLAQGVTYVNYYMGHGGSNFNWAAQDLTTTYDYAAPVREGGWLWEKYYAMRELGMLLALAGEQLARAVKVEGRVGLSGNQPGVGLTVRAHGDTGFIFLRDQRDQPRRLALELSANAATPARRLPAAGEIFLPARAARLLPLNWDLNGRRLLSSTAEVLAAERSGGRELVLLAAEPGEAVEAEFAAPAPPSEPLPAGVQWLADRQAVRLRARVGSRPRSLRLAWNHPPAELQVFFAPRHLARRLWISPVNSAVSSGKSSHDKLLWFGDASLLESSGRRANAAWAELQFTPGRHRLQVALPRVPRACRLAGRPQRFRYHPGARVASLELEIPPPPATVRDLLPAGSAWSFHQQPLSAAGALALASPLPPLQHFGRLPYGYVIYEAGFHAAGPLPGANLRLFMHSAGSAWRVFINAHHLPESGRSGAQAAYHLGPLLKAGRNRLVVCYEMFGAHNFGPEIAHLKGLKSATLELKGQTKTVNRWRLQLFPASVDGASRGRDLRPGFDFSIWPAPVASRSAGLWPGMIWARRNFTLPAAAATAGWFLPWELHLEADSDALIYVNGKFIGRYAVMGPQNDFYLPEPWLRFGGRNELVLVLPYRNSLAGVRALAARPIAGAATCRRRIEWVF